MPIDEGVVSTYFAWKCEQGLSAEIFNEGEVKDKKEDRGRTY